MTFHILTLFPEVFESYLSSSIIGRTIREGKVKVSLINFRDFSTDKHRKVDDTTYGGGAGMVLQCEPLYKAIKSVIHEESKLIFFTPQGGVFNQKKAVELSTEKEIILVCGFYEGFDCRIFQSFNHEKLSIGDYILTNGGLAALTLLDCVVRIRDNVLNNCDSIVEESFSDGLLEYDQFTKPSSFLKLNVPDVLLSGHHKMIERWRRESSLINTINNRPDLIEKGVLSMDDIEFLISYIEEKPDDN